VGQGDPVSTVTHAPWCRDGQAGNADEYGDDGCRSREVVLDELDGFAVLTSEVDPEGEHVGAPVLVKMWNVCSDMRGEMFLSVPEARELAAALLELVSLAEAHSRQRAS